MSTPALEHLDGSGHRVVILQPNYLPWRGYFHLMELADTFVFLDDVQYDKDSWRNRNRIKGPNGSFWITVPVLLPDWPPPPIIEIRIDNTQPWRRKHRESIRQCYARAPHAAAILPVIERIYEREWDRIADLDIESTFEVARLLGIATRCVRSSEMAAPGVQTERIIEICRRLNATHYLSGPAAKAYIEEERFRQAGIRLEYMEYAYPPYPQQFEGFDPQLSIVDVLMNCGPEAPEYIWGKRARAPREIARA